MRRTIAATVVPALALGVVSMTGCGSDPPFASSQRCRRYATELDIEGYTRTCTFDISSSTYQCGGSSSRNCAAVGNRYSNLFDFVEEARVPNRPRLSESFLFNHCGMLIGSGSTTQTYTYDAQDRLLRVDGSSRWGYASEPTLSVGEYTEWDARGRPISGTVSWGGQPIDVSIVYDDTARSMTTSYGDGRETVVQQDAFGNTIRDGDDTYTVLEMEEVCF